HLGQESGSDGLLALIGGAVGAQSAEGGGVGAALGSEVTAKAEHVCPGGQTQIFQECAQSVRFARFALFGVRGFFTFIKGALPRAGGLRAGRSGLDKGPLAAASLGLKRASHRQPERRTAYRPPPLIKPAARLARSSGIRHGAALAGYRTAGFGET